MAKRKQYSAECNAIVALSAPHENVTLAELEIEPKEVVADKGYHSNATIKGLKASGLRSYDSEPDWGRCNSKRDPDTRVRRTRSVDGFGALVASGCCAEVAWY